MRVPAVSVDATSPPHGSVWPSKRGNRGSASPSPASRIVRAGVFCLSKMGVLRNVIACNGPQMARIVGECILFPMYMCFESHDKMLQKYSNLVRCFR